MCGGFSPHFVSGRLHRENIYYTLVLPSMNRFLSFIDFVVLFNLMSGRKYRRVENLTLVLPSMNRNLMKGVYFVHFDVLSILAF